MNCRDIARLLDNLEVDHLSAAERGQAEIHLASCAQCASEWAAHEQMLAVPIPPMPGHLEQRCRALIVAASSQGRRRRVASRPMLVGALFIVGAAAAAVFTFEWSSNFPDATFVEMSIDRDRQDIETVIDQAESVAVTTLNDPSGERSADSPAPTTPESSPGSGADPGEPRGFIVAVPPLAHSTTHPDVVAVTESIFAAVLEELQSVQNLNLMKLDAPLDHTTTFISGVLADQDITIALPASGTDDLVLDRVEVFALEATRRQEAVDVPTELRDRVAFREEAVSLLPITVETSADPAAVNVMRKAEISAELRELEAMEDDDLASRYDFVLTMMSSARLDGASSRPDSFSFRINGRGTSGPTAEHVNIGISGQVYDRIDVASVAKDAVDQLRKTLFEPDNVLLEELQAVILDQTKAMDERLEALSELQIIADRSELEGRTGPVVAAAIDMVVSATDPDRRAEIWTLLRGSADSGLVQPLIDALLYDPSDIVRLEAARALSTFEDDPTALVALEQAGKLDASADVRMQATWLSRDNSGRLDYVVSSLRDTSLSDTERLAPLLFARSEGNRGFDSPTLLVQEQSAETALIDIMSRVDDPELRTRLIGYLARTEHSNAIGFLVESLRSDPDEPVRAASANLLREHLEAPGVRAALEEARTSDSSPEVRARAATTLNPPKVIRLEAVE